MVYSTLSFLLWKNGRPEEELQGVNYELYIRTEGNFFTIPTVFPLEDSI